MIDVLSVISKPHVEFVCLVCNLVQLSSSCSVSPVHSVNKTEPSFLDLSFPDDDDDDEYHPSIEDEFDVRNIRDVINWQFF